MKNAGYLLVEQVLREFKDEGGTERSRFIRFMKRFSLLFRGGMRQSLMLYKVWLYPSYLWAGTVNTIKLIQRTGTEENRAYRMELRKLISRADKIKTAKEYNNQLQAIQMKYKLRKQRILDHKEH